MDGELKDVIEKFELQDSDKFTENVISEFESRFDRIKNELGD